MSLLFLLQNEKWVRLIEMILNGHLFDFVVENTGDQQLLNQLIKQAFTRPRQSDLDERSGRRPAVICNKAAFNRVFKTATAICAYLLTRLILISNLTIISIMSFLGYRRLTSQDQRQRLQTILLFWTRLRLRTMTLQYWIHWLIPVWLSGFFCLRQTRLPVIFSKTSEIRGKFG